MPLLTYANLMDGITYDFCHNYVSRVLLVPALTSRRHALYVLWVVSTSKQIGFLTPNKYILAGCTRVCWAFWRFHTKYFERSSLCGHHMCQHLRDDFPNLLLKQCCTLVMVSRLISKCAPLVVLLRVDQAINIGRKKTCL